MSVYLCIHLWSSEYFTCFRKPATKACLLKDTCSQQCCLGAFVPCLCLVSKNPGTSIYYFQRNPGTIYRVATFIFRQTLHSIESYECATPDNVLINSLWPRHAMSQYRSGTILALVRACCLTEPRHYLNQCWLIIFVVLWHYPGNNFAGNTLILSFKITSLLLSPCLPGANALNLVIPCTDARLQVLCSPGRSFLIWCWIRPGDHS